MKRSGIARKTPLKAAIRPQKPRKPLRRGKSALSNKRPAKGKTKPLGKRVRTQKGKTWAAVSLFIRSRDKTCVTCKERPATQAGHYKHNSDKQNQQLGGNALWYDERNYGGQCTVCNCYNSGELDLFALHLEAIHGAGILQELERLFQTPRKWTMEELVAMEEEYGRKLARLRG